MRIALFLFFVFSLTACSSPLQAVSTPAEDIVLKPLPTPTAIFSPTPTAFVPTLTPQPLPTDPAFFRDDFNGQLDSQWSWVRERPQDWSLVALPGSLQIMVDHGYVAAHNNFNLLLRPAPNGDFQIETQITFRPADNFQFAGLIIYQSDSNFIQAGRSYCSAVGCIGEGLYLDYYKKGLVVEPNLGLTYKDINPIRLRLTRQGETYTFDASTDGKVWFIIGSHTSDIQPSQIGLVAGQTLRGKALPASFDYFEVHSIP